ncbi:MAG: DUF935 family protein [Paludibacteraceae bacterium]|nr:DUF935 family protein [Paludibacteraceae bacterium]
MTKNNKIQVQRTRKNGQDVVTQIIREFKDQTRAEIKKWRNALRMAADIDHPHNYMLQDLYDNLEADGHFIAQVLLRKAATTGYSFGIINKETGKKDDEKTELFQSEWFYNFLDHALDSVFKGYTVLELTNPATMELTLIPRRNLIGTRHMVLLEASADKGIDISQGYEHTLIHVGKPEDLGVMAHLCGQLIWKRNAQQSWAEFTERFGMPLISATTNKTSQSDIDRIDTMLAALGESARAVLPEGTSIKIDPFTGGDAYKVFYEQIECINAEMSKPITGGTMVTDDGSSRSQSEVHERNLDDKLAESDRRKIQFVVNNQLIPIMQYWGWPVNPETDKFQWDDTFDLTPNQHWNIVNQILNRYTVDQEWIAKTFNVPILEERQEPQFVNEPNENDEPHPNNGSLSRNFR